MKNDPGQNDRLDPVVAKGVARLKGRLDKHLGQVLDVRKEIAVKDSSLITDELTNHIPTMWWNVKKGVANLRSELKAIIWEIAAEHEKKRFDPIRQDFARKTGVGRRQLERGGAVLESEQQMYISYHSLFLACKVCSAVNKTLLAEIEAKPGGRNEGAELLLYLKNAIIVFEVTSLIIDMIQQFQLKGRKEFQSLRDIVFKELAETETNSGRNVLQAGQSGIPSWQKEETMTRDRNLKEGTKILRQQWMRLEDQIYRMRQSVGSLSERLPSLKLTRDNAKVQLDFLELIAVTQMMNQNIQAIEGMANLELELAPLTSYDVCRLIGLESIEVDRLQ